MYQEVSVVEKIGKTLSQVKSWKGMKIYSLYLSEYEKSENEEHCSKQKSVRCYKVTSACEFCIHVYTCMVLHVYNDIKLLQGETSNNPSSYKPG